MKSEEIPISVTSDSEHSAVIKLKSSNANSGSVLIIESKPKQSALDYHT